MTYDQLITGTHDQVLRLRSLERLIQSDRFRNLYEGSNAGLRAKVEWIIYQGDLSKLQRWMQDHPDLALEECTLQQLRNRARFKRIRNYSRLYKHELIRELQNN